MNLTQKETIINMREKRMTYAAIAQETGLSINTVKSICYRNGVAKAKEEEPLVPCCKNCGEPITEKSKQRPRLFCSDQCKQTWWNKHRKERNSSSIVPHVCATCGKTFNDYSGANRKYCSQACFRERNKHDGE